MANEEHLAILKQGVKAWNKWRQDNFQTILGLGSADSEGIEYGGRALRTVKLVGAHLQAVYLGGPEVRKADLGQAVLRRTSLGGANLYSADLSGTDLRKTDLSGANLSLANLAKANLSGANIQKADLTGADLSEADLGQVDLAEANVSGAILSRAALSKAKLMEADFTWADLPDANLSEADLTGANLSWAVLTRANLVGAQLYATNLTGADVSGLNVENARVGGTLFVNVALSGVKGLETIKHSARSAVDIDTIFKSKGKIPEVFLRGCGAPDNFITYIGSLVGKAFEYYSCFISYSSQDQELAERLHADLQAKGVRCWFAPEDLKIGDRFRPKIDEAIRLHDKLLLILSEHSVSSDWVGSEVEAALEKERQRKQTVLFPVRLDDVIWETDQAWAADIRRTRQIGDFANWKDHDAYQKAFERLLRDLKAESAAASE